MDAVKRVEAGFAVPDICQELGISTATFYKWRAKYGGMDVLSHYRFTVCTDTIVNIRVLEWIVTGFHAAVSPSRQANQAQQSPIT